MCVSEYTFSDGHTSSVTVESDYLELAQDSARTVLGTNDVTLVSTQPVYPATRVISRNDDWAPNCVSNYCTA